jgi:hypothetical protein
MKWPAPPLRRWTSAEEHKLREMLEAGKSVAEIAQQLDRTPKAISANCIGITESAGRPPDIAKPFTGGIRAFSLAVDHSFAVGCSLPRGQRCDPFGYG